MMTDPIADMLTRIRNAANVNKKEVTVPFSKIKRGIAEILVCAGYLASVETTKDKLPFLTLTLKYDGRDSAIHSLTRMSTPGHRRYIKKDEITKVLNGFGVSILSTSAGLLTGAEAREKNVGGELICEVY